MCSHSFQQRCGRPTKRWPNATPPCSHVLDGPPLPAGAPGVAGPWAMVLRNRIWKCEETSLLRSDRTRAWLRLAGGLRPLPAVDEVSGCVGETPGRGTEGDLQPGASKDTRLSGPQPKSDWILPATTGTSLEAHLVLCPPVKWDRQPGRCLDHRDCDITEARCFELLSFGLTCYTAARNSYKAESLKMGDSAVWTRIWTRLSTVREIRPNSF